MQIRLLLTLVAAALISANAAAAESCDRAALLALLPKAPAFKSSPEISQLPDDLLSRFMLSGSPLAMDGFRYEAVVNTSARTLWFVRYGGIAGDVQWAGPVFLAPEPYAACASALPARLGQWQIPAEFPRARGRY